MITAGVAARKWVMQIVWRKDALFFLYLQADCQPRVQLVTPRDILLYLACPGIRPTKDCVVYELTRS